MKWLIQRVREAYQKFVFIILENFHDRDELVKKNFHLQFTQDPEGLKNNLLNIPSEEFFERLLQVMSEIFHIYFVWHRYNLSKEIFDTYKFRP